MPIGTNALSPRGGPDCRYVAFPALSLRLPLSAESRSSPERTASSRRWESRTSARNEDSPARRQMRVSSHTIAMPNALEPDGCVRDHARGSVVDGARRLQLGVRLDPELAPACSRPVAT